MQYDPANGSIVSVTPVSWAIICWVRKATLTASSDGRASASSKELVCSDCVPPSTAANDWNATRMTLLIGCVAVSVHPDVWMCILIHCDRGFLVLNRCFMILAHSLRAALNLAISSRKLLWAAKKKDSLGANWSTFSPRSSADSTYAIPSASVKASSCTAFEPASRMWYPLMLMGFHFSKCFVQYSVMSVTSLTEGSGGNMHSFCAWNSFRLSFWVVPPSRSLGTPCMSPIAMYIANSMVAGPLMVIEVVTLSKGIPLNRTSMSCKDETATPHLPTSPNDNGWSESKPSMVG